MQLHPRCTGSSDGAGGTLVHDIAVDYRILKVQAGGGTA